MAKTTESFIEEAKIKNKNSFDYSKVTYVNNRTKIELKCNVCGHVFQRTPKDHLRGYGCPKCNGTVKLTKEIFINRSNKKYNNKYDYSKVVVDETKPLPKQRVTIICPIHGEFEQTITGHLHAGGCRKCGHDSVRRSDDDFLKEAREIHGDKYTYSKLYVVNNISMVDVTCPKHGTFTQTASQHIKDRQGCKKCFHEQRILKQDDVIERMKKVKPEYDYSKVVYKKLNKVVEVICKAHGSFWIRPGNVINLQQGCPKCAASRPEKMIMSVLDSYGIEYKYEYPIWTTEGHFRYDFYIKEINIYIEYHGRHHYFSSDKFERFSEENLNKTIANDRKKVRLAKEEGRPLYVISYKEDIKKAMHRILKRHYRYNYRNQLFKTGLDLMRFLKVPDDFPVSGITDYKFV